MTACSQRVKAKGLQCGAAAHIGGFIRMKDLYTGGTHIGDALAREAVEEAAKLVGDLEIWLDARGVEEHITHAEGAA